MFALIYLWLTLTVSIIFLEQPHLRIFLVVVGIAVTIHLFMLKTMEDPGKMKKINPTTLGRQLIRIALVNKATHAAMIPTELIPFDLELRQYCLANSCGMYDKSWMGPPAIGEVEALIPIVRSYPLGLIVQTVGQLEDSYDWPGMMQAKSDHETVFQNVLAAVREYVGDRPLLALSAGCCNICDPCTYPDQPCLQPGKAVAPVEAYGINVNKMLIACDLKYNNGQNTVSYVGLVLLKT